MIYAINVIYVIYIGYARINALDIIITQWALDSYLDLRGQNVFNSNVYWSTLRPDILLLKIFPQNIKFKQSKFWSVAQDNNGIIQDGYKMKWHQVGTGLVQLRLPVGLLGNANLCEAYVKNNTKSEKRQLAKFKTHLQLIKQGNYTICGRLI